MHQPRKLTFFFTPLIIAVSLFHTAHAERPQKELTVNIPNPQTTDFDASFGYGEELLKLALTLSSPGEEKIMVRRSISAPQKEALDIIEQNKGIDVYWVGTSIARERKLLPVRIPIFRGMLGMRMSLVHKDTGSLFYSVTDSNQMFNYRPCLGSDWPDADIFEANGFNVKRSKQYRGLLDHIMKKECDFLPLAVSEINAEYKDAKKTYKDIRLYNRFIFYYPFPMYFFVNKDNTVLAKRIELGLEKAIDMGLFDKYMRESLVTRHLFPLEDWIHAKYITLENPLLPRATDIKNPRYWLQLPSQESL